MNATTYFVTSDLSLVYHEVNADERGGITMTTGKNLFPIIVSPEDGYGELDSEEINEILKLHNKWLRLKK